MKLLWRLPKDGDSLEVLLKYNMYLGTKKIFINNTKILTLIKPTRKSNTIEFEQNGQNYKLELMAEDFSYSGNLITPEGAVIAGEKISKEDKKTPLWTIPFIICNMIIPIISPESYISWFLGIASSYVTAKITQRRKINIIIRVILAVCISMAVWKAYSYFFRFMINRLGFQGNFIPSFKK